MMRAPALHSISTASRPSGGVRVLQKRQSPGEQDRGFGSYNVTKQESTKMSKHYDTPASGMGGGA